MTTSLNSAAVGALVREARHTAGMTQSELAQRIGASRFWVVAFEKGKPSAELGLALKAIQALGLAIRIEARATRAGRAQPKAPRANGRATELATVIARATLTHVAPSSVTGWPSTVASLRSGRTRTR